MKTIIVTGAGSGLGKELSLLFAQQGFHVFLIGRTVDKLASVKDLINAAGGSATIFEMDISKREQIQKAFTQINKTHQIYGLVNNAGVGYFGPFPEISDREVQEMLDTNILGTIQMTKEILPLLERQEGGLIINIISTAGLRGKVNEAVYAASKFAVRGFTESLQKEYAGSPIGIKAVYMGGMDTPFWEGSQHVKDTSRFRTAKDVAELIIQQLDKEEIIIESSRRG